jgi:hypothetical protein
MCAAALREVPPGAPVAHHAQITGSCYCAEPIAAASGWRLKRRHAAGPERLRALGRPATQLLFSRALRSEPAVGRVIGEGTSILNTVTRT